MAPPKPIAPAAAGPAAATPARVTADPPAGRTPVAPADPAPDPAAVSAEAEVSTDDLTAPGPSSGDSLSAFSSDRHVDDIWSHFALGVEGTSNSIGLTPRSEYSSQYDPVDPHKEWDRYIGLAAKARIGSWRGFSLDPRFSIGVTRQDGKPVSVQEAFGSDAVPVDEVPTIPDEGGPEVPLPPTQDADGNWQPGGTRPATPEDINHANLSTIDIDSSGYQWKLGADLTWMAWDWIGVFAGPTYYRMWGDYDTSGQHNVGAPHADIWTYSEQISYEESGWGGRVGLTIRPLASVWNGRGLGLELNPFYEYTQGSREIFYQPAGRQTLPGDNDPSVTYGVERHMFGVQAMFYLTPAKVAIPDVTPPPPSPPPVTPTPPAVAECKNFDDSTLIPKLNAWKTALYVDGDSTKDLKADITAGLKAIGMSDADIASLSVNIYTFHAFNGATGILPANPSITRDVVLTITRKVPKAGGGGTEDKQFILWDKRGLALTPPQALKPLEAGTLVGWIAENSKYIEKKAATEAAISKFNTGSYKFAVNYPKTTDITTLSVIADVAAFETALNRSGIFSDYAAAKANMDIFVTAMGTAKDAVVYLAATTDTSGNDADNQALSERRAAVMQLWLKIRGLQARAAYGLGEDTNFIKAERNAADRQANRAVIVVVADKDSPLATGLNPDAAARALIKADLTRGAGATEITVAVPGKPAEVAQVSPVKIADRILLSTVATGDKPGYEEGAACATLVIGAKFYMTDGTTPASGLPEAKHTLLKPAQNLGPWLDEPERVEAPAGAVPAGAAPARPAAAVSVIPAAADPDVEAFEDYDKADEAVKQAEGVVRRIEESLNSMIDPGSSANTSLAGIRAAADNKEKQKRADLALLTARQATSTLNDIIPDMQEVWHGIMNANGDELDNTIMFWSNNHAENKAKLKGRIEAALKDAEPKVKDILAKLAAFIAAVEAEKAKGITPPVAGAPAAPAAPALKWTPGGKLVGSYDALASTGTASVEVEGTIPAELEVAEVAPGVAKTKVTVASVGSKHTLSIPFTVPAGQTKNYVVTKKGTAEVLCYVTIKVEAPTNNVIVTNSTTAPAAPVAGAGAGAGAATALTWNPAATVAPTSAADKASGKVTALYTGPAPTAGFEVKNEGGTVVARVTLAPGSIAIPYAGLTVGGRQVFKIRVTGAPGAPLKEVILNWTTASGNPEARVVDPVR